METRESRGRKRTFEAHGYEEDSQGSCANCRPSRRAERWRLSLMERRKTHKFSGHSRDLKVIGLCETFEEKVERVDCIFRF